MRLTKAQKKAMKRIYRRWVASRAVWLWVSAPPEVHAWIEEGVEGVPWKVWPTPKIHRVRSLERVQGGVWGSDWYYPYITPKPRGEHWEKAGALICRNAYFENINHASRLGQVASLHPEEVERNYQTHVRALLKILPLLILEHGLSARLLDVVREHSWLTFQVVRALGLPDLVLWKDWFDGMAPLRDAQDKHEAQLADRYQTQMMELQEAHEEESRRLQERYGRRGPTLWPFAWATQ